MLYSRYRSAALAAPYIPLALIESVTAMWIAGVSLSVAPMVGFTLFEIDISSVALLLPSGHS